ncbi:MAG: secretin N-terminal domain-containing protein [Burkholderiales bacterium]|nr:secretin N-terminal domain-containing protein [Burkholderiales bacterium]
MTARAHERTDFHWRLACLVVALAAALLLCVPRASAQATVLEVISLKYRTAEQVIPMIQPMLRPGGSISGLQNQLIVRTTPDNHEEIRRILAGVDTLPRQLVITVRQDADGDSGRRAAEISGSVRIDDSVRITVPGTIDSRAPHIGAGADRDGVRARIIDTRRAESDRNLQTVQVLEGNAAFIRIGQSVPVPRREVVQTVIGGQVVSRVVDSVEYRDVASGFNVLPRITGDRVTLDINPQHDTLNRQMPGAVNVQRVATTVSGRLGEWIEIAGLAQQNSHDQSVLLGRSSASGTDNRRVLLKVEEAR